MYIKLQGSRLQLLHPYVPLSKLLCVGAALQHPQRLRGRLRRCSGDGGERRPLRRASRHLQARAGAATAKSSERRRRRDPEVWHSTGKRPDVA